MSNIGERVRQERQRLGFNQEDFAALAECSKKSQIHWEKSFGPTPNANVLAAWAKVGADVQFIVTGTVRNSVMASLRAAVDYARSEQLSRLKLPEQAGNNT